MHDYSTNISPWLYFCPSATKIWEGLPTTPQPMGLPQLLTTMANLVANSESVGQKWMLKGGEQRKKTENPLESHNEASAQKDNMKKWAVICQSIGPRNNYWEGSIFEGALLSEPSSQLSVAQRNSVLNWFKTGLACQLQPKILVNSVRAQLNRDPCLYHIQCQAYNSTIVKNIFSQLDLHLLAETGMA